MVTCTVPELLIAPVTLSSVSMPLLPTSLTLRVPPLCTATAPLMVTSSWISSAATSPPLPMLRPVVTVPLLRLTVPSTSATGLPPLVFQVAPEPP